MLMRPRYSHEREPHRDPDPRYSCGCVACEAYRAAAIVPGGAVRPVFQDPKRTSPGTTSWWRLGEWTRSGWSQRFQEPVLLTVIGDIPKEDRDCGHLDCALCLGPFGLVVTSKKWLVRLDLPIAPIV